MVAQIVSGIQRKQLFFSIKEKTLPNQDLNVSLFFVLIFFDEIARICKLLPQWAILALGLQILKPTWSAE